jgi:hypothetical protein
MMPPRSLLITQLPRNFEDHTDRRGDRRVSDKVPMRANKTADLADGDRHEIVQSVANSPEGAAASISPRTQPPRAPPCAPAWSAAEKQIP